MRNNYCSSHSKNRVLTIVSVFSQELNFAKWGHGCISRDFQKACSVFSSERRGIYGYKAPKIICLRGTLQTPVAFCLACVRRLLFVPLQGTEKNNKYMLVVTSQQQVRKEWIM